MRRVWWAVLGVASACSPTPVGSDASPPIDATTEMGVPVDGGVDVSLGGPRGVYVPTFDKSLGSSMFQPDLSLPYVDGFFLSRAWNTIELEAGVYSWDALNQDILAAAAAGKKVTIAIPAGDTAPSYICNGVDSGGVGARCVTIVARPPQGGSCNVETIPLPWDPILQARFGDLIASLANDILSDPTLSTTVVDVKVTGFNERDEETILPSSSGNTFCDAGVACSDAGVCAQSPAVAVFEDAGFSDTTARAAYMAFAHIFRSAFPKNLPIGSMVSSSLPSPGTDDLPFLMVQDFVNDGTLQPITVQDNGLSAKNGVDPGTLYARDAGVIVGYQMLAYVANNTTCLMGLKDAPDGGKATCDEGVLLDAINNGLSNGARWLEIYTQDVTAYPDASTYAHTKLTGP